MRYLIFLVFLLCASVTTFAQTTQDSPSKDTKQKNSDNPSFLIFGDIKTQPSFPGGEAAMLKFIKENMQYPTLAKEQNVQGKVAVSFVVDIDGKISDISVLKDIGGGCGKEAVRIVGLMPAWIPGVSTIDRPLKIRYTLPIKFELP